MPLSRRASVREQDFRKGVSYRVAEGGDKLLDALNVISVQDRLDTRHGTSRYNSTTLGGSPLSLSFFVKSSGSRYCLAKVGTTILSVATSGAHTTVKSALTSTTRHRAITDNDRHIIAVENDGLYSFNGTTFTQLGQAAPTGVVSAAAAGGSLTDATIYQAAVTFYASSIGFESNPMETTQVTTATPNLRVALTSIPTTAANALIDKVRIYLKDVTANGSYLYVTELSLGTASYNIDAESTSTQTPPENNGTPLSGGGKYLASFNSKLVYAGNNSFPNEVYFSEPDLPDAFNPNDDADTLVIRGQGGITGLATGLFSDSVLDPFLAIFKRKSIHIYSEIGGQPRLVPLSFEIGCVSHDTIQVKNGVVFFLSDEGWRAIANGQLIKDSSGEAVTLGGGDIDDIFKSTGYVYEVSRTALAGAFSAYYPTLDQYITWVAEGSSGDYGKAYCYEFDVGGFKPWQFAVAATCACLGETSAGRDQVLFGTTDGYILKHSIAESRSDVDTAGATTAIDAMAVIPWVPKGGDMDATYNFRELILRAIASSSPITVKAFLNFNVSNFGESEFSFTDPNAGFILDESILDEGVFGDERIVVTARTDINRVGESIAIGFYQNTADANMSLVSMQLDFSKNGNRNS